MDLLGRYSEDMERTPVGMWNAVAVAFGVFAVLAFAVGSGGAMLMLVLALLCIVVPRFSSL